MKIALGIDVGATGTKGALVDISKGELTTDRFKLPTPASKLPNDIISVIDKIVAHFDWKDKEIGIGVPAVVQNGIAKTASNIDKSWINFPVRAALEKKLNNKLIVINDADAAGLAEFYYNQNSKDKGTKILLTLGTGIGSAIFLNGELLRNTELGHLKFKGKKAEKLVSNSARIKYEHSWEEYGKQLGEFLQHVNDLFYPDVIILGGGISKKMEKFSSYFPAHLNVKPASQFNNTGIVGAALATKLLK